MVAPSLHKHTYDSDVSARRVVMDVRGECASSALGAQLFARQELVRELMARAERRGYVRAPCACSPQRRLSWRRATSLQERSVALLTGCADRARMARDGASGLKGGAKGGG